MKVSFLNKANLTAVAAAALLSACGGSGGGEAAPATLKISGSVVDSAIVGAKVCLFADGVAVKDSAGAAVCSAETDSNGAYTLTVPASVADAAQLTLRATKDAILLTSALGTKSNAVGKSGGDGELTTSELANAKVTHFTTADLVLADADGNGFLSTSEISNVVDPAKRLQIATVIKAAVDYGQTTLLGGTTINTLLLAQAAAAGQKLGSTNAVLSDWYADTNNASIVEVVKSEVPVAAPSGSAKYTLSEKLVSYNPDPNNNNSFYCTLGDDISGSGFGTSPAVTVDVAFDPATGKFTLVHPNPEVGTVVGTYNPTTYQIAFSETSQENAGGYSFTGTTSFSGKVDPSTGTVTGTLSENVVGYWTGEPDGKRTCSGTLAITMTKK